MDKEEILEKSRKEHNDEWEMNLENKKNTIIVFTIDFLCFFLGVFNMYLGKSVTEILLILGIINAINSWFNYKIHRRKLDIFKSILFFLRFCIFNIRIYDC